MNMTTNSKAAAPVIEAIGLQKNYGPLEVLKGLDLSLKRGEVVALIGPSGSGKSTFIRCLNMMEIPTGGTIRFRQKRVGDRFRDKGEDIGIGTLRRHVGMVFQHFNLFPHKTVMENVTEGPIVVCKRPKREARELAMDLLAQVGLGEKHAAYPAHLSGGQKQRVAIARALANDPRLVIADEPTGNLDPVTTERVFATLIKMVRDEGAAVLVATHNFALTQHMDRVLTLKDGKLVDYKTE